MTFSDSEGLGQFSLRDRAVLVTGGGTGLGRAMARSLAAAGAHLVLAGRTRDTLEATATEIGDDGGTAHPVVCDATCPHRCEALVAETVERLGGLDAAVINHGTVTVAAPEETADPAWDEVIATNLTGCFYAARAVGRQLITQGRGGALVLTSSTGSLVGFPGLAAYGASKGGVDQLARQLATEWGRHGIRVNTVNPGYTTHTMGGRLDALAEAEDEVQVLARTPLGRRGEPEDFAGAVVFLCSDAARFISGSSLVVDGGYCAR